MNKRGEYDDIIDLPHFVSKKHPRMTMLERAAQFHPFSALTGYDDIMDETGDLAAAFKDAEYEEIEDI